MKTTANEIERVKAAIESKRTAKQFDSEYWNLFDQLKGLRAQLPATSREPVSFRGSYQAAVEHFGGAVKKVSGGLLSGSVSEWVKR